MLIADYTDFADFLLVFCGRQFAFLVFYHLNDNSTCQFKLPRKKLSTKNYICLVGILILAGIAGAEGKLKIKIVRFASP